ncbi:PPE family protein [Herbihabitans rhizosphaerae]|uniref:PPE family protein n=1 Tax=Herbihabitans rhizosphaerae TaxID=1872711 RepID=A0A4V2EUM3_9PSEU|nr:PPE domain-containing protein [Herbihabitans rhizosphaerae]RZS45073.1 PPE family protein [Herbihabitans rhizosphaerae]
MSGDKAITDSPNWLGYSHPELHRMISAAEPSSVDAVGGRWSTLGEDLTEIAKDFGKAVDGIGNVWQGEAADAAHATMKPLSVWGTSAGRAANLMSECVARQAEAVSNAKNTMPPPVADPRQTTICGFTGSGPSTMEVSTTDLRQQAVAAQEAHRRAAQVMEIYEQTSRSVDGATPTFTMPPGVRGPNNAAPALNNPAPVGQPGSGAPTTSSAAVGGNGGQASRPGDTGGSTGTRPSPGGPGSPGVPIPGRVPHTGHGSTTPSFGGPPSSSDLLPGRSVPGAIDPQRPSNPGAPGYPAPFGPLGTDWRGGSGSGNGSGNGSGSGRAGNAGARLGMAGGEPHAGTRAAGMAPGFAGGGAGRNGMHAPMMPMGRGGRQGEDEEHSSPDFLMEADDLFGPGGLVAPPVIGENLPPQ